MDSSQASLRKVAPLGPRVFGVAAFLIGLGLLWVGYTEFAEAAEKMSEDLSMLENPSLAPLAAAVLWSVFSTAFMIRQLVKPTADYAGGQPEAPPPASAETAQPRRTEPAADTAPDSAEVEVDEEEDEDEFTEPASDDVQWRTPSLLVVSLVVYALALEPLGFMLATSLFFLASVWLLGSRHLIRDAIIGVVLSVSLYFSFTEWLSVSLPSGLVLPV